MRSRLEREDLLTLGWSAVLVAATWFGPLAWRPGLSIPSGDALTLLPITRDLLAAGGGWEDLLYRPEILGGVTPDAAVFALPLLRVLAWLGLGPVAALNGAVFAAQALLAFFGATAAARLGRVWLAAEPPGLRLIGRAGVAWLTAFAPFLSWSVAEGRFGALFSLLVLSAAMALLAAGRRSEMTFTLAAAAAAAFACAFPAALDRAAGEALLPGILVLGGLAFVRPIVPGGGGVSHRGLRVALALTGGAALVAVPRIFVAEWAAVAEPGATAREWLSQARIAGPALLLALIVPWRASLWLGIGLACSAAAPVLASMAAAPALPARGILPFLLSVSVLAPAALAFRYPDPYAPPSLGRLLALSAGALGAASAAFLAPPAVREPLGWAVAAFLVLPVLLPGAGIPNRWRRAADRVPGSLSLLFFGALSLGSFGDRLAPSTSRAAVEVSPAVLGRGIVENAPELASPLVRARIEGAIPPFAGSSAYAIGLSSLSGQGKAEPRFAWLTRALPGDGAGRILEILYNQRYVLRIAEGRRASLEAGPRTPGEAWFSSRLLYARDFAELGRTLLWAEGREKEKPFATFVRQGQLLVAADSDVEAAGLPKETSPECIQARVIGTRAVHGSQDFSVLVRTDAACPLTLATNYAGILRAEATLPSGAVEPARLYPAYGALAGVWVPEGAREIRVFADPRVPLWARLAPWLGGLLIAGALARILAKRRENA